MAKFLAQTSKGLVDVLEQELHDLGITKTRKIPGGVNFESNWRDCYRANIASRTATRIILPVLTFPAYQPEDIYNNIKKHDFTKYIGPDQTLAVNATVDQSKLRDQRTVALKSKDAIVDQFREKFDRRPDVAKRDPDLLVVVQVFKNNVMVSVDTSGVPLFKRGYRVDMVDAPLKEHVAAALVLMSDWDKKTPIMDPCCGSGTLLIEAALIALNVAPGTMRKNFAFMNFAHFNREEFDEVLQEFIDQEKEELDFQLYGRDISGKAIKISRANAAKAGVDHCIDFLRDGIATVESPLETEEEKKVGWILMNPPYGVRLGHVEQLKDVYRDMSFAFKQRYKGWNVWMLSGDPELSAVLKMKADRKFFLKNGPIECRWLNYKIY